MNKFQVQRNGQKLVFDEKTAKPFRLRLDPIQCRVGNVAISGAILSSWKAKLITAEHCYEIGAALASNVQEKHAQLNSAQIISDQEPFFITLLLRGHEPKHNSSRLDIHGRDVEESELSQPVMGLEDALSQSNGIKFQNKF